MTRIAVADAADAVQAATTAVAHARATFASDRTKPLAWRTAQLEALRRVLADEEAALTEALRSDLGRGATAAWLTEIGLTSNEISHTLAHLARWLRPRRVPVPLWLRPARAHTLREPLGVVLVIAPWNYPLYLSLMPLVGALAAGNAVVLKPSEHAPATSRTLARLLPAHLDADAVHVVEGGVPETTALLQERFDHIFYTGNGRVGRIVLEAAARHLTPVTLELGGKSPAFVDEGADLEVAARRIAWGKFTNAGQTCVAPDYVIGTRPVLDELKPHLAAAIEQLYADGGAESADYGRIVHEGHFDRVLGLVRDAEVVVGGGHDRARLHIEPTVIDQVDGAHPAMAEEIFGPVLPLVEVAGVDEAIGFITARDKPLALYVFTGRESTRRRFTAETSSGALGFNAPMAHLSVPDLPFGGVGASGIGAYHGEASVALFSHEKPVLSVPPRPDLLQVAYPPLSGLKERLIRHVIVPRRR